MNNIELMRERAPLGEKWSDQLLKAELSTCGGRCGIVGTCGLALGIFGYPFIFSHFFSRYLTREAKYLLVAACTISTGFGSCYIVKKECVKNIKNVYAEERRKELEVFQKETTK